MIQHLYTDRLDLAESDASFIGIVSRSRFQNFQENVRRFQLDVSDIRIFEDLSPDELQRLICNEPTIFSVSGTNTLWPYLQELQQSRCLISEFLCWKYISSFTPLDFYPPKNWADTMDLFEDNATKRLFTTGFLDQLVELRELVEEISIESLLAYETVLALLFRTRIPKKAENFYYTKEVFVEPGETVLDCGACADAFGGQFVTRFAADARPNGRVIAFEPIDDVFHALENDVDRCEAFNVVLINSAVLDHHTTLDFVSDGISSRMIQKTETDTLAIDAALEHVRAVPIDDVTVDQRVDFIKMDVEGAELQAILGAKTTIQTYRPKLAICLYHRPSDFIEIPKLLKSLCPDYTFWLECNEGHSWAGVKLFAKVMSP